MFSLFCSQIAEKLHFLVIMDFSNLLPAVLPLQHCSTLELKQTPGQTLKKIDAGFSIDVLKSLKLPVMDRFVKSTLKTHLTCHQLPSAVVGVS